MKVRISRREDQKHYFCQATPAEVPDYDDNSVAPVNPNAPIVEVIDKHKTFIYLFFRVKE